MQHGSTSVRVSGSCLAHRRRLAERHAVAVWAAVMIPLRKNHDRYRGSLGSEQGRRAGYAAFGICRLVAQPRWMADLLPQDVARLHGVPSEGEGTSDGGDPILAARKDERGGCPRCEALAPG